MEIWEKNRKKSKAHKKRFTLRPIIKWLLKGWDHNGSKWGFLTLFFLILMITGYSVEPKPEQDQHLYSDIAGVSLVLTFLCLLKWKMDKESYERLKKKTAWMRNNHLI